jgi:hypothetical protein
MCARIGTLLLSVRICPPKAWMERRTGESRSIRWQRGGRWLRKELCGRISLCEPLPPARGFGNGMHCPLRCGGQYATAAETRGDCTPFSIVSVHFVSSHPDSRLQKYGRILYTYTLV